MLARIARVHVERGAVGVLFFQWRASLGGAEQWHSALVPHAGPRSRIFREACALGADLPMWTVLPRRSRVALWYDEQCDWALDASHLPVPVDYRAVAQRFHALLDPLGVEVIAPGAPLSAYEIVVLPAAYLLTMGSARALRVYVEGGGTLLAAAPCGLVDEYCRVYPGGYPGGLRDLLGVWSEELCPTVDGRWAERCHATAASVEVSYPGSTMGAILARHAIGSGCAWYLSCDPGDEELAGVVARICQRPDCPPPSGS